MNITNNEIVQNSKSEPKKFSILCTFNGLIETSPIQNEDSQWYAAPFLFRQVWSKGHR